MEQQERIKKKRTVKSVLKRKSRIFWLHLSGAGRFFKKLWKHPKGKTGLIFVAALIFVAIFAPFLTSHSPTATNLGNELMRPSWQHWLGTDANGIDIFTQILYGSRVSLMIGLLTGVSVTLVGALLGVASGYLGKFADSFIMRTVDVLIVIPTLPLIIILHRYVSQSYLMMIAIFVIFGWGGTARVVRSQVLSLRNSNYIKAAEQQGASKWYVMHKHILPAVSHLLIMNAVLACAGFMIAEAGLSFLGLGDPNAVSWGQVLVRAEGAAFTSRLWAWVIAPGVAIFIAVFGFMQIGRALEEIFNPRLAKMRNSIKSYAKFGESELEKTFKAMDDLTEEELEVIRQSIPPPKKPAKSKGVQKNEIT